MPDPVKDICEELTDALPANVDLRDALMAAGMLAAGLALLARPDDRAEFSDVFCDTFRKSLGLDLN